MTKRAAPPHPNDHGRRRTHVVELCHNGKKLGRLRRAQPLIRPQRGSGAVTSLEAAQQPRTGLRQALEPSRGSIKMEDAAHEGALPPAVPPSWHAAALKRTSSAGSLPASQHGRREVPFRLASLRASSLRSSPDLSEQNRTVRSRSS